ncbi:MAG: replication factor C large subunit [Candidatus Bathyarchaeota archaeon]|nr:MAG: replication factor C large subunit [Candidatus Bathyarchaeota archaeon]
MYAAWTVKHKPQTLSEVVGNEEAIRKLTSWITSWNKGIPKKRAAFLHGPPGVGKTVAVEALAHDLKMELVEKNASDYRTAEAVQRFAGLASQYATLFGGKRVILLDELDGITGTSDRGGVRAVIETIKTARYPVVLIANNAYNPKFSTLRRYCLLIEFKKPTILQVMKRLKKVCAGEGIMADERALKLIGERSGKDVRSAINDLQALAQGRRQLTYEDVAWLAERDRKEVIFKVMRDIFYARTCVEAKRAVDTTDVDPDMLFQWIYENAPYQLTDARDLAMAMEALARADVYRGRIRATQNWKLLRYVFDLMTAGVAMSRQRTKPSGWVPYRFPERIRWLARTKRERQMQKLVGMKIRRRMHVSSVQARKEILPYMRVIFEDNAEMAAGIAKWLDLDEDMIKYLAGTEGRTKAIVKNLSS